MSPKSLPTLGYLFPLSVYEPPCCLYDHERARASQRITSGISFGLCDWLIALKLTKHRVSQSEKRYYLFPNDKSKMANKTELEERLRELCCIGDERNAKLLIERGVSINTVNAMNGWTPLHWAAKRGHASIVKYLVQQGADTAALTNKGETAAQLSNDTGIKQMLGEGGSMGPSTVTETLPIVPNYLRNPEFFYAEKDEPGGLVHCREQGVSNTSNQESSLVNGQQKGTTGTNTLSNANSSCAAQSGDEIVLKLRIADSEEKDFIEVDLNRSNLTFRNLEKVCCEELDIEAKNIKKIRKLPNTIVRNDKDMTRLLPYQELEVVLTGDKMFF